MPNGITTLIRLGSFGYKSVKSLSATERRRVLDRIFVELTKQQKDEIVRGQLVATLLNLKNLHKNKSPELSALFGADAEWLQSHVKGSVIEDEHKPDEKSDSDSESDSDSDDDKRPPEPEKKHNNRFSAADSYSDSGSDDEQPGHNQFSAPDSDEKKAPPPPRPPNNRFSAPDDSDSEDDVGVIHC